MEDADKTGVIRWLLGVISVLTRSPRPLKSVYGKQFRVLGLPIVKYCLGCRTEFSALIGNAVGLSLSDICCLA